MKNSNELDFYVPSIKTAIQVAYEINENSIEREVKGFENVKGKRLLVTLSNPRIPGVKVVNAMEFLM